MRKQASGAGRAVSWGGCIQPQTGRGVRRSIEALESLCRAWSSQCPGWFLLTQAQPPVPHLQLRAKNTHTDSLAPLSPIPPPLPQGLLLSALIFLGLFSLQPVSIFNKPDLTVLTLTACRGSHPSQRRSLGLSHNLICPHLLYLSTLSHQLLAPCRETRQAHSCLVEGLTAWILFTLRS